MSEQTDAEVALDWARDMGDPDYSLSIPEEDKRQFRALVSALEATEQRAEEAEADREDIITSYESAIRRAEQRAEEAEREYRVMVDQYEGQCDLTSELLDRYSGLAAVVEKVRGATREWEFDQRDDPHQRAMNAVRSILNTAPQDVLREVKAAAWDEGVNAEAKAAVTASPRGENPYRKEQS